MKINIFWFRRDLRLEDNHALFEAACSDLPVLPVFIFDTAITDELPADDPRITFIYDALLSINDKLARHGSSLLIVKGDPLESWKMLTETYDINAVYINKDYEPYAKVRDDSVELFLRKKGIKLLRFIDQVIFEEKEIVKSDNDPYTVFTPYKNRWLNKLKESLPLKNFSHKYENTFVSEKFDFPSPEKIGFKRSNINVRPFDTGAIREYDKYRDYPAADKTTYLGPHLRFGTVSIRKMVDLALCENQVFLSELIWREFFMQILFQLS